MNIYLFVSEDLIFIALMENRDLLFSLQLYPIC